MVSIDFLKSGLFLLLFFLGTGLFAQKIIINDKGEKILLHPDGRWEIVKEDSTQNQPDNVTTKNSNAPYAEETPQNFVQYNPTTDVALNPPSPECVFAFDGIDEFSGQKRKDIQSQIFFTYTPEQFRKHFDGKEYITCRGNLTKISGGFVFLNLEFEIYSKDAIRAFGGLPVYSQLNIRLLNGDNVRLLNKKDDFGTYDSLKKVYHFKGQYAISRKQEKTLTKSEIDKVRVVWGTGFEDYEIYEIDFFINQFRCLEK